MDNIRNLRIIKNKIVPLVLAGGITLSLVGCSGEVDLSSVSANEIISSDEIKGITLFDELLDEGKLRLVDELTLVEAADRLSQYMDIVDKIDEVELEDVTSLEPISEEEKEEALGMSLDEIDELIQDAKLSGKKMTLEEMERKINAHKKLTYLVDYCKDWIRYNGKDVSIDFMMAAVKASVASELGLGVDDYSSIVIPPLRGSEPDGPGDRWIKVGDTRYIIPISEGEIINTIDYIYSVQVYNVDSKTSFATYRKAINYAKTTIAAGVDLKDERLVAQNDAAYVKKYQNN